MKTLILMLASFLASGQVMQEGIATSSPAATFTASACGSSITGVLADYWAGSLSTSPITTNWTDSHGSGNAVSPTASPTWSASTFGSGLAGVTTNGSSQYFSMTTATIPASSFANLSFYAVFTVAAVPSTFESNHNSSGGSNSSLSLTVNSSKELELDKQFVAALCTSSTVLTLGDNL